MGFDTIADKAILKGAVQKTIMCQKTGHVLDVRTAVLAELSMTSGNIVSVVVTADVWPDVKTDLVTALGDWITGIKVYNGPELFGSRKKAS